MKKVMFPVGLLVIFALLPGCASHQGLSSGQPLCLSNIPSGQAMQAAYDVLRGMQFEIEKFDTDSGYIRTRPLSGAQFFEVWRQDNASAGNAIQSNIHSLRRIVEMECTTENATTCIDCRVQVVRLSIPERPIEGSVRMGGIYTESNSRYQTLGVSETRQAQIEWIDAGQDYDLEKKILEIIQKKISKREK